ncbi:MAG: transcription antitermination factor NusB [Desulfurivibrio sp.]|nr:transcription antitermination factor NusB [Desulfurivibrio sp.]
MSSINNMRQAALELLLAREQSGQPVEWLLERYRQQHTLADQRDRRLLEALVYGVLRWQGLLDQVAAQYARHPLRTMKPLTLTALRLGLLQLLLLERIPASAALNETIKALRAARQPRWLTGFVNAVLRKVAGELASRGRQPYLAYLIAEAAPPSSPRPPVTHRNEPPDEPAGRSAALTDHSDDPALMAMAAWLSHPSWLRQRWDQRYGPELSRELCRSNNCLPPLVLRVNLHRLTVAEMIKRLRQAGWNPEYGRYAPAAVVLPAGGGRIEELPGYQQGWFAVQDEAAQLVTMLLASPTPGRYLDACAGVGGKTAHLAELLPPEATITALEPQENRFGRLTTNQARLGFTAHLQRCDLATHAAAVMDAAPAAAKNTTADAGGGPGYYRGILVDAPCSGLGVIRRHPDIRWNRLATALQDYQRQQLELLTTATDLLQPGGVLVYVVCSFEPEENEEVITRLLKQRPELRLTAPESYLPPEARPLVKDDFFRCLPTAGLDGFFAARLCKNAA